MRVPPPAAGAVVHRRRAQRQSFGPAPCENTALVPCRDAVEVTVSEAETGAPAHTETANVLIVDFQPSGWFRVSIIIQLSCGIAIGSAGGMK